MTAILANNQGDIRRSYNKPVADNQDIKKGDPITVAAGLVSKGAVGTATIHGFATHDVKTGVVAASEVRPRVIYDTPQPGQQFKGTLSDAVTTPTNTALEGTDAGFIVEAGEFRISPAAATKQLTIDKVVEPFTSRLVVFRVKNANVNS